MTEIMRQLVRDRWSQESRHWIRDTQLRDDAHRSERVAHKSTCAVFPAGLKSAQNPVTAMVLGEIMGHVQAQIVPPLKPRADDAAAAITGGLAAGEPSGVLSARSGW